MHRREYGDQVRLFLISRVLVVLVVLAILLVYEEGSPQRFQGAYVLMVLALTVSAIQLGLIRITENLERLVLIAVCMDVVFATLTSYFTGGIYNIGFTFLYFASILSAVILISDAAGWAVASLGTFALGVLAVFYYLAAGGTIEPPFLAESFYREIVQEQRAGRVTANLIGIGLAFFGVAFLGSRLPRRLSQAQVLYDEIVERMGEGVVAIDRRGRILIANGEARRMLNWQSVGPLVGRRFEQILRRQEDQRVLELLARGEDANVELELHIRGRSPIAVEVKTTVLFDQDGRVRGVVGIFRDLSLRRRVAEVERRLARLLDIEQLALGIAHEIRNPLGSIRGAVQELASHSLTDEADQKLAGIVRRESDRLDRIIQQFLDFARMRPPIRQRLELADLVEETVTLLEKRDEAEGVTIEYEPPGSFQVQCDPDQLRQAVMNIGLNALQALEGKGRLRIRMRAAELSTRTGEQRALASRPAVEVAIDNDGPPMSSDHMRQVFTPFFTTKEKGLGLGMAITQKVVRNHEGDVFCAEGELGGPSFHVLLPLAAASRSFSRRELHSKARDERVAGVSEPAGGEG